MQNRSTSPIQVILATDDNFAAYAATVILSVIESRGRDERHCFRIITTGLSKANLEKFNQLAFQAATTIEVFNVAESRVSSLPETALTKNTYLRMFAPEMFPDWHKAVYLDCDVLVRGSLKPFVDGFDSGEAAIVVPDHCALFDQKTIADEVDPDFDLKKYFNAGVMGLNLETLRSRSIVKDIEKILETRSFAYKNQTSMNIALKDQCEYLPLGYNITPRSLDYFVYGWAAASVPLGWQDIVVIHYTGREKPWKRWVFGYGARRFRSLMVSTPWGNEALAPVSVKDLKEFIDHETKHAKFQLSRLRRQLSGRIAKPMIGRRIPTTVHPPQQK